MQKFKVMEWTFGFQLSQHLHAFVTHSMVSSRSYANCISPISQFICPTNCFWFFIVYFLFHFSRPLLTIFLYKITLNIFFSHFMVGCCPLGHRLATCGVNYSLNTLINLHYNNYVMAIIKKANNDSHSRLHLPITLVDIR